MPRRPLSSQAISEVQLRYGSGDVLMVDEPDAALAPSGSAARVARRAALASIFVDGVEWEGFERVTGRAGKSKEWEAVVVQAEESKRGASLPKPPLPPPSAGTAGPIRA